jgi:hypothetical protein
MAAKKKSTPPTILPAAVEPASHDPVKVTLADTFLHAGDQSLARMLELLGLQIDVRQISDPTWLADAEHRRVAAILIKLLAAQMNVAIAVVSGQIRVGTAIRQDVEKERQRALVLEDLRRKLLEPEAPPMAKRGKPSDG